MILSLYDIKQLNQFGVFEYGGFSLDSHSKHSRKDMPKSGNVLTKITQSNRIKTAIDSLQIEMEWLYRINLDNPY